MGSGYYLPHSRNNVCKDQIIREKVYNVDSIISTRLFKEIDSVSYGGKKKLFCRQDSQRYCSIQSERWTIARTDAGGRKHNPRDTDHAMEGLWAALKYRPKERMLGDQDYHVNGVGLNSQIYLTMRSLSRDLFFFFFVMCVCITISLFVFISAHVLLDMYACNTTIKPAWLRFLWCWNRVIVDISI